MQWSRDNNSQDVEDRRGSGGMRLGGIGLLFSLIARFGWKGGLLIFGVVSVAGYFFVPGMVQSPSESTPTQNIRGDEAKAFVGSVLDDAQGVWRDQFARANRRYTTARVVLFSGSTSTGCGYGDAAVGPFYCPRDGRVYLDTSFFDELHRRFGAPGDFAQAYVIAHEIGHHVQRELGVTMGEDRARGADSTSVHIELQADCYAGVWAHSAQTRKLLDPGDIEEALGAASAVGDDRLQKASTGHVQPESWTHGSAAQRATWFRRGLASGDPKQCDTFAKN